MTSFLQDPVAVWSSMAWGFVHIGAGWELQTSNRYSTNTTELEACQMTREAGIPRVQVLLNLSGSLSRLDSSQRRVGETTFLCLEGGGIGVKAGARSPQVS